MKIGIERPGEVQRKGDVDKIYNKRKRMSCFSTAPYSFQIPTKPADTNPLDRREGEDPDETKAAPHCLKHTSCLLPGKHHLPVQCLGEKIHLPQTLCKIYFSNSSSKFFISSPLSPTASPLALIHSPETFISSKVFLYCLFHFLFSFNEILIIQDSSLLFN